MQFKPVLLAYWPSSVLPCISTAFYYWKSLPCIMLSTTDSVLAAPGIDKNESDIKTLQKLFLDIHNVQSFEVWGLFLVLQKNKSTSLTLYSKHITCSGLPAITAWLFCNAGSSPHTQLESELEAWHNADQKYDQSWKYLHFALMLKTKFISDVTDGLASCWVQHLF